MPDKQRIQLVWFKRDLRCSDHAPLMAASLHGPVLPVFVVEPDYWQQTDTSHRQWAFVHDCLVDLRAKLTQLGQPLVIRFGNVLDVFEELRIETCFESIWSHEETGNAWTYQRDRNVRDWCRSQGIAWEQIQQHGTQRRLKSRNGWAKSWDKTMALPITEPPKLAPLEGLDPGILPRVDDLKLRTDPCPQRQAGGRDHALKCLDSFLHQRGENYRKAMSSPLTAQQACSRLSPYLAWGSVSVREVAQATWRRQRQLREEQARNNKTWREAMTSFSGRLHWHCHFIQKLEDEPKMEFENLHRAYDGMRPKTPDTVLLDAWRNGQTGLPFVDACMRYLKATGWINFRMRAMLMAVSSYHLWLDWREPGLHLARMFTDYEPGIHWPQVQMQSGTTGINTVRIYNPVKQGMDQDPFGKFMRSWLPELSDIEDEFIHQPWLAPNASAVLDVRYPFPVIDHLEAARQARRKVWSVRGSSEFRNQSSSIQRRHGSRKSGIPMRGKAGKKNRDVHSQLSLKL